MAASAPATNALHRSPPVLIPPSMMMGTYRPVRLWYSSRAAAQSMVAVTCGTPTPVTSRVVQAAPGPTPTRTPWMPVSISSSATSYETQLPTITGTLTISRSSGKRSPRALLEMCLVVVTVDWTTTISAPASAAAGARLLVLAGVTETAHVAPSSLISSILSPINRSSMGAEYISWRSPVTSSRGVLTMRSSTSSASWYLVCTPSRFMTPRPP